MRGNFKFQAETLMKEIYDHGGSKHKAKQEALKELKENNMSATSTNISEKTGIYGSKTYETYANTWKQVLKHAKEQFKINDIEKLNKNIIKSYLEEKYNQKVSELTFRKEISAINKLQYALNRYAENNDKNITYNFKTTTQQIRKECKFEKFETSRAYDNPRTVIEKMAKGSLEQLRARIQLESGARRAESNKLSKKHLRGYTKDPFTGELKGIYYIKGKGGYSGNKFLSLETYKELEKAIQNSKTGKFFVKDYNYYRELKVASIRSNQAYQGTHGLRWNFTQERFLELQKTGLDYVSSLQKISNEMFHNRTYITEHYLK